MMQTANTVKLGNAVDLSAQYGAPAYQVSVVFTLATIPGLTFRAQRFVRSAKTGYACDNVDLFVRPTSEAVSSDAFDDYQGRIAGEGADLRPSRVTERALELLAVAEADVPADTSDRFAMIELY